jgi:hypothetical protein
MAVAVAMIDEKRKAFRTCGSAVVRSPVLMLFSLPACARDS